MFSVRRFGALYVVFMTGLLLGHIEGRLLFILGVPILMWLVMATDEVKYNRNTKQEARHG